MSAVIAELQTEFPELYSLVQQLGNTQRNVKGSTSDEELKGGHGNLHSAQCTLCKGKRDATSDKFDAGCKGNRKAGIYIRRIYTYIVSSES